MRAQLAGLVVGVVHRSHLPLAIGQGPFVVLSDVNMVLLLNLALNNEIEPTHLRPRLLDSVPFEEEQHLEVFVH